MIYDTVLRFFTCDISGDECAIVARNGETVCVTAAEAYEIEAAAQARYDAFVQRCEMGW